MTESIPTPSEWRRLYQAAIRVKEIAPWEWMTEADIFGVQDPGSDEISFVVSWGSWGSTWPWRSILGQKGCIAFGVSSR